MQSPTDLESVVGQSAGASLVVNESGTILFATDQACHLLKYAAGELHGQSLELLIPERYRLAHIGHRLRFTDDRRTRPGPMGAGLEPFAQCKDGCERRVDITLIPVQRGFRDSCCRDDASARLGLPDAIPEVTIQILPMSH